MCGIVGVFDFHNRQSLNKETLEKSLADMTAKIYHRGPDSTGYYTQENLGLGFTRLSIIDLSGGNQPLYSFDEQIVLVSNGEIFNYIELREELLAKGYPFKTHSDIEVIIPLYLEYGKDFVNKLNGQFAFALYDKRNDTLICGRDYVGICPLYYTLVDGYFIFGSEIKSLLAHPLVKGEVDLTGLDQIMTFPGLVAPRTMFRNIQTIAAGHYLCVGQGKISHTQYWDINYPKEGEIEYVEDENYYAEKLDALIEQAVKIRLRSDVPVGFYLSGGLDSSFIAQKISKLEPNNRRHSFSINFTDAAFSEQKYQKIMAEHVNSIHHETLFDLTSIETRLRQAVYYSESPLKETYNTASHALSEMARKANIKVVLTGEGADELLAGYVGYRFDSQRESNPMATELEAALENKVRDYLWGDRNFLYEKNYYALSRLKKALYSNKVNQEFDAFLCLSDDLVDKEKLKGTHPVHKRSYLDFKLRLCDHLISDHGDRMLMANSVEGRFPFLDKDVIDFIKVIPPHLKLNGNVEKYLLKSIAKQNLPQAVTQREKFSFVAQGSDALIKQDLEWVNDLLSYDRIKSQGYFNPDQIEKLKQEYKRDDFKLNLPFDNDFLIIVLTFGLFLEEFNLPNY